MEIKEILRLYNVPTAPEGHHHRTSNREQVDCPWCSPYSGKWRMGITRNGRASSCWVCGSHPIIETMAEVTKQPRQEIRELLKNVTGYL